MEDRIDKRSADSIIASLQQLSEDKTYRMDKDEWLDAAWYLNSFYPLESKILNGMRQEVARAKLDILGSQEKRSLALAEVEVEASDTFRLMKDQEAKIEAMKEYVRIAKKNAEDTF